MPTDPLTVVRDMVIKFTVAAEASGLRWIASSPANVNTVVSDVPITMAINFLLFRLVIVLAQFPDSPGIVQSVIHS